MRVAENEEERGRRGVESEGALRAQGEELARKC